MRTAQGCACCCWCGVSAGTFVSCPRSSPLPPTTQTLRASWTLPRAATAAAAPAHGRALPTWPPLAAAATAGRAPGRRRPSSSSRRGAAAQCRTRRAAAAMRVRGYDPARWWRSQCLRSMTGAHTAPALLRTAATPPQCTASQPQGGSRRCPRLHAEPGRAWRTPTAYPPLRLRPTCWLGMRSSSNSSGLGGRQMVLACRW
jgi:hypothetical protein